MITIIFIIYTLIAGAVFGTSFILCGLFPRRKKPHFLPHFLPALLLSLLAGVFWFLSVPGWIFWGESIVDWWTGL